LSPESTDLLLDIMKRCRTGEGRLKGILPGGTEVAHKTGTIGRTLNDVGIITLPNGAGHVIVAAFVKASSRPESERERAIAEAARAAHDYFLFASKP
jgi:beta-lactamase class A